MSPFSGPFGTWWKIASALIPFAVAAIFTFATLKESVHNLQAQILTKADASVAQANQEAVLRELNTIEVQVSETRRLVESLIASERRHVGP